MAITQAMCNSFKQEILVATHDFTASTGDQFKVALFLAAATLNKSTTAYAATNESSGTGYTAGGNNLTSVTPVLVGDVAVCDFADTQWTSATITARGCLIYNSSKSNKAVSVHDFGADRSSTDGTFSLVFPTADGSNAIIRIG